MKGDKLYRAIGDADDKYIQSAKNAFDNSKKSAKRKNAGRILKRVLSVAAAVIIIGGVWAVSFIVAQNRHDPVTPANTGDPADTKDEPSTEADTTFKLSPYVSESTEVDPDGECGKMIQAFDAYLKTKEFGKYGEYYVSYCVKINGAYIGFIDDGDTDYTQALENEVIDGLPFCYGNGKKLTVISSGEYRYGLAEAFNDGLLNSDKLDQFFVRYSSDHKLYKEFESEYLRQSCEEFLGGENERNIKEKPEKDKELSLYNYIRIPYCKMLGDYKYAVLYLLWHQPAEECTDEYYTVSVGGYDFPVRTGLRFHIYDQGDVYPLDRAQLTAEELKALYDSYTKYEEPKTPATTEAPTARNIPELKELFDSFDINTLTSDENKVEFAYKTEDGVYIGLLSVGDLKAWEETVAGCTFYHGNGNKFLVIKDDTLIEGIAEAYEQGVISAETVKKFHDGYIGIRQ